MFPLQAFLKSSNSSPSAWVFFKEIPSIHLPSLREGDMGKNYCKLNLDQEKYHDPLISW